MNRPIDRTLEEISQLAGQVLRVGGHFHQKWTCDGCGERISMNQKDVLHAEGFCEDCGATTDLRKKGCGLLVVYGLL